jgi:histidyl-tRNA synthetase
MADNKVQRVRGTQDLFGDDIARFDHVVETFNRVRKLYGFRRVDVPIFEHTSVFARSLGETTDVVSKEMYSFEDRGGDSLTLRPEFTAGIARAYISNGWQQHGVLKLAAHGPLFRYERPQKGRYRQFHQLDAEIIGAAEPAADVEVIAMGAQLLAELGVADKVVLQLNTLGDAESRAAWREALVAHFSAHADALSGESRERLAKNPLRILDSKAECDRPLVDAAPRIDAHMTADAGAYFEKVQKGLQAAGVALVRNEALVRGFDYYRHTAFEFVTEHLGAQGTVIGGGRYDGLIGAMGGPETPAIGWAAGIERLGMLVEEPLGEPINLLVTAVDDDAIPAALTVLTKLRAANVACDSYFAGSPRKRYERAQAKSPRLIIYPVILPERTDGGIAIEVKRGRGAGEISGQAAELEAMSLLALCGRVEQLPLRDASLADLIWFASSQ